MSTTTQSSPAVSKNSIPSTIRIFNTLSKNKEPLEPLVPGKVGIYLCGPTVYKPSHVGHMVGPVIFDAVKRYLTYIGYQVTWVVNITDVDDKLIAESGRRGISMAAVAEEMTDDYMRNLAALGVDTIDHFPKATEHIDQIVVFIEKLIERGYAYNSQGDVYFDVGKDPEYGKLSRRSLDSIQGEGGGTAQRKHHPADFALWKTAKLGEPSWDSPWGPGRPGWHIECSVMSHALLGESFDIHGGGLDLEFPHHENEIAQSECCHGRPMAKYWMHNGLLRASSEAGKLGGRSMRDAEPDDEDTDDAEAQAAIKISKSKGAEPFRELLARHAAETIRFFVLSTHYRSPIDFSDERIEQVHAGLETFYRFFKRYERITGESFYAIAVAAVRSAGEFDPSDDKTLGAVVARRTAFLAAMDDDFNTGGAIGELFDLVRALNKFCEDAELEGAGRRDEAKLSVLRRSAAVLAELAHTLGLFRKPPEAAAAGDEAIVGKLVQILIDLRATARKNKDFATSDAIRDTLQEIGITLEDRSDGTDWSME